MIFSENRFPLFLITPKSAGAECRLTRFGATGFQAHHDDEH
jgi:hypothetical protein